MSERAMSLTGNRTPGFWRRIRLHPTAGLIRAGLEDDFHRFLLDVTHVDGVITAIETRGERIPWSTCADAGVFLAEQVVGQPLTVVAGFDPYIHCTHLFELLVLCAFHANDPMPTQWDLHVPDREQGRTCATLLENGREVLRWPLNGSLIESTGVWSGRDLRQLSQWKSTLTTTDAERAMLLRRAVHISGGRNSRNLDVARAADRGPSRMGACFTYQMPRALDALRTPDWVRDFSQSGIEPLRDFESDIFNAANGGRP